MSEGMRERFEQMRQARVHQREAYFGDVEVETHTLSYFDRLYGEEMQGNCYGWNNGIGLNLEERMEENNMLEIGQRVISETYGKGTIIIVRGHVDNLSNLPYGVKFDTWNRGLHSCNMSCADGYGRYVSTQQGDMEDSIKVLDGEFEIFEPIKKADILNKLISKLKDDENIDYRAGIYIGILNMLVENVKDEEITVSERLSKRFNLDLNVTDEEFMNIFKVIPPFAPFRGTGDFRDLWWKLYEQLFFDNKSVMDCTLYDMQNIIAYCDGFYIGLNNNNVISKIRRTMLIDYFYNVKFQECPFCGRIHQTNMYDGVCVDCARTTFVSVYDGNRYRNSERVLIIELPDALLIELSLENAKTEEFISTDNIYSNSSWRKCHDCGLWITDGETIDTDTRGEVCVCGDCMTNYTLCEDCDHYYAGDFCSACSEEDDDDCGYRDDNHLISSYHPNITWTKRGEASEKLAFGFELEVENKKHNILNDDMVRIIKGLTEDVIYTHDGSLDDGFEIVSHPMTYDYIKSATHFKKMMTELSKNGFKSHETRTCGLHFHVSRAGLGRNDEHRNRTINNIILLFENFQSELIAFSRREQGQIEQWAQFLSSYKCVSKGQKLGLKYVDDNKGGTSRYMAVNLKNSKTVEFRLFRGTLNYDTFIATLDLLKGIIDVCKEESIAGIKWYDFCNTSRAKEYSKSRGILNIRKKANEIITISDIKKYKRKQNTRTGE